VVEFAGGAGDGPEAREELVSANLLGSHEVDILVEGTQIPLTLLYTIQDAMRCIIEKQILVKVRCYGETRSPVRPERPVMITKGIGVLNIWQDE
jgi:hypothetical protein